jgi:hypothetical protein
MVSWKQCIMQAIVETLTTLLRAMLHGTVCGLHLLKAASMGA